MREGGFPAPDEPLDSGGLRKAGEMAPPSADQLVTAPGLAAQATAEAMGLSPTQELALRDIDHGRWAGRSFAEVATAEPEPFAAWLANPAAGAPGGETLSQVIARAGGWVHALAPSGDAICAIAGPTVIRAIIAAAIGLPIASALRIDIAPLSTTTLSFNRIWRLQAIRPA